MNLCQNVTCHHTMQPSRRDNIFIQLCKTVNQLNSHATEYRYNNEQLLFSYVHSVYYFFFGMASMSITNNNELTMCDMNYTIYAV